ncbi:uncharacterized protein LOC130449210 [Diorhabda sublineata]|uniref:uncharacterized protein LOC130449210 n=1 Tax=Diorhabda sublineata TaxID=1163346 RepID=UPI0024E16DC0|nr:uncharacterized protein LOC130449210 [Diorhabda sublineata]
MVIARHGKPDLFITMTCNPRWPEIIDNLGPHQKWENRPDLVCRVFHAKLLELMDDLTQKQIFGVVKNYHYVIEFQKRGLPHAHIVLTMQTDDKVLDVETVDAIVQAYIPDKNTQRILYGLVRDFHVHAPCGQLNMFAKCMMNGQCKKFYPKPYRTHTSLHMGGNKRPEYKRPDDGRTIYVDANRCRVTNRRIVPYNAYLLSKYQCHINIEVVGSFYTMKYLHKYIQKGSDSITLRIGDGNNDGNTRAHSQPTTELQKTPIETLVIDEIKNYQDYRYVSAMEAMWRILEFRMHDRSHSVLVLPVHLPGDRTIMFDELEEANNIEARLQSRSKLEAYFELNSHDVVARTYLYHEIPQHYTWNYKECKWQSRRQVSKQIGCMIDVSPLPGQMELFFFRLLLSRIKGATTYDDLKKIDDDGTTTDTFEEACGRKNYIRRTDEFERAMREAVLKQHPRKMRKLFALYCCITIDEGFTEYNAIWHQFCEYMIDDFVNLKRLSYQRAEEKAFKEINEILKRNRSNLSMAALGIRSIHDNNRSDAAFNRVPDIDNNINCDRHYDYGVDL